MSDEIDTAVANWLSRITWLGLMMVLTSIIALSVLLSAGAADPLRAGPLLWQTTPAMSPWLLTAAANQSSSLAYTIVPRPPFTLEITARFSSDSDPVALWRVSLAPVSAGLDMRMSPETVAVDGSGDYAHGTERRRIPFPHLTHVGGLNRLTLTVDKDGLETLRFNNEIAWRGMYSPGLQATQLTLSATGGWQLESTLTWALISVYAPEAATVTSQSRSA